MVAPFEKDLKEKLLVRYKIINEGELFCSDFKYRFSDSRGYDYIGALGKSNEDAVNEISTELATMIRHYKEVFREVCHNDKETLYTSARLLYFAAYFNLYNRDSGDMIEMVRKLAEQDEASEVYRYIKLRYYAELEWIE